MVRKIRIVIYKSTGKIVGGDANYLFDLLNNLDLTTYDVILYADKNPIFEKRANISLRKDIRINYLNTKPKIFSYNPIEVVYEWLIKKKSSYLIKILDHRIGGRSIYRYLRFSYVVLTRLITLAPITDKIINAIIFYKVFQANKQKIDIFHVNNGGYPAKEAALIAIIVAHFCGIKNIIMTFHNQPCQRRFWKYLSDFAYDKMISKYCKLIISVSDDNKNELVSKRRFPPDKIKTIYYGIPDCEKIEKSKIYSLKTKLNIDHSIPILLTVGNLDEPRKGHTFLFDALDKVKAQFNDFKLFVVGSGRVDRKNFLTNYVGMRGLDKNIIFLGERKDIPLLNAAVCLVIVPSIGAEGLPYTIIEGMRAGKPVITTDTSGCTEAIKDNFNGLIVPKGNVNMLAAAILRLLRDEELRGKLGKEARKSFLDKFLLSKMISEHQAVYQAISLVRL